MIRIAGVSIRIISSGFKAKNPQMQTLHFCTSPPPPPPPPPPAAEIPTESLPKSTALSKQQEALLNLLQNNLRPFFSPEDLVRVMRKMHHRALLTNMTTTLFTWAKNKEGYRHDHTVYEFMVRTLASHKKFSQIQGILDEMSSSPCPCSEGTVFSCPRLEPIYITIIESYVRVSNLGDAIRTFDNMLKVIDGKPPIVACNVLLGAFVRDHKLPEAVKFYERMIREFNIMPDVCTFNILINGLCKKGDLGRAFGVFRDMKSRGFKVNVVSYNTLIFNLCRQCRVQDAVELCFEMVESGVLANSSTFEILFEGLIREGKVDRAIEILLGFYEEGAVEKGLDFVRIVEVLCKMRRVDDAVRVVNELWDCNVPSVVACTVLLDALEKKRNWKDAGCLLQRMLECDLVPDIVTFNAVMEGMCRDGSVSEASQLRALADGKGLVSNAVTFRVLFEGFCMEGMVKEGSALIDEMLDKDFIHDIRSYNSLMDRLNNTKRHTRKC